MVSIAFAATDSVMQYIKRIEINKYTFITVLFVDESWSVLRCFRSFTDLYSSRGIYFKYEASYFQEISWISIHIITWINKKIYSRKATGCD